MTTDDRGGGSGAGHGVDLGGWGVWSLGLRLCEDADAAKAAQELEALGFRTVWIPGIDAMVWDRARRLLDATERLVVATGIVSIWTTEAPHASASALDLETDFPGRFLLGVGVSHAPLVARAGLDYGRPYSTMVDWLDELDAQDPSLPVRHRMLGANHPRMLKLAGARSLGSHTYLGTPAHSSAARDSLGPTAVLAPEQCVVLETDPVKARAAARAHIARYLGFPNYVRSWMNQGFSEADLADEGSDHFVDSVVAWGSAEQVAERLAAHRAAGADHVCVQVIAAEEQMRNRTQLFSSEWRALAQALRLGGGR